MRLAHAVLPTVVPACLHYGPDANMLAAEFIEVRSCLASQKRPLVRPVAL